MLEVTLAGDKELERKLQKLGNARSIQGRVWNDTSYGPFVQRQGHQAWMHRGRWHTDQSVIDANRQRYLQDLGKSVDAILSGKGAQTGNPLRMWMTRTVNHVFSAMEKYAPMRAGQRYPRTYTLKGNWRKRVRG